MSLIPAFKTGVWNVWILMIWLLIPYFLEPLKIIPKGREGGNSYISDFSKKQKATFFTLQITYLLMLIYSIFVPLQLGTVWFYTGLPIYLLGLISYLMVFVAFATTPPDKLVIGGIYHYSRNPMQLSMFILLVGLGIVTASWIFSLLAVTFMIMPLSWLKTEEHYLLNFYGDSYKEYTTKTPRWIGIPK